MAFASRRRSLWTACSLLPLFVPSRRDWRRVVWRTETADPFVCARRSALSVEEHPSYSPPAGWLEKATAGCSSPRASPLARPASSRRNTGEHKPSGETVAGERDHLGCCVRHPAGHTLDAAHLGARPVARGAQLSLTGRMPALPRDSLSCFCDADLETRMDSIPLTTTPAFTKLRTTKLSTCAGRSGSNKTGMWQD